MNSNTIFIVLIFTALFLELNITVFAVLWQKNKKNKPLYKYNHKNSKMYLDMLNEMIKTTCSYKVDIILSKKFRVKLGDDTDIDISTDEYLDTISEISMDIINQMSDHMKTYLYNSFGVEWIHSYINIKATYEVLSFASKL